MSELMLFYDFILLIQQVYCECLSPVVLHKELCNLSTTTLEAAYLEDAQIGAQGGCLILYTTTCPHVL